MPLTPLRIERLVQRWITESGERVAARRIELDMKRSGLARKAKTTEATIHRIEHGAIAPRDHLKIAIAQALQCQPGELWPPIEIEVSEVAA
jgi:DNA-binding XRE family transcriptional regulator